MNLRRYRTGPGWVAVPRRSRASAARRGRAPATVPAFGPLQGVRVVDTGRVVAGPWAATFLGDFGAEIVHVETPPFGPPYADPSRTLNPVLPAADGGEARVSESWVQYGRNKLSVGIDVGRPEGREVLLDLLKSSDIWIEASRPGTFDKLGLSDATVLAANPKLVVVHISGFGQTGRPEYRTRPSYDLIAQAFSGFLGIQGDPEPAPPLRAATAINDLVTGLAGATSALMGYVHAQRTGQGQVVDVAQYEIFFLMMENMALDYFARGQVRQRVGNAHPRLHPYEVLRAKDGWIVLAAPTPGSWRKLRELFHLPDTVEWNDMAWRASHRSEVNPALEAFTRGRTVAELEAWGLAHDVAFAPILSMADIARNPHYKERGMLLDWDDPVAGRVTGAGIAPRLTETPGRVWRGAPWLGQDNDVVLGTMLGYGRERLDRLKASGIIGADSPRKRVAVSPPRRPRRPVSRGA